MVSLSKSFLELAKIIFLFFLFSNQCFADEIPTAEDVNRLAEMARFTFDAFMQESFEPRMRYEYSGKFLFQDDKDNLQRIAKRAGEHLEQIIRDQEIFKQRIEEYEADDWDEKYGQTGLWRKLSVDIYYTKLSKYEADFYESLTDQNGKTNEKLKKILSEIELLNQNLQYKTPVLLKGKILAALSKIEPAYKKAAIKELHRFKEFSDVSRPVKAKLELIKLTGQAEAKEFNVLFKILQQNRNEELILELSFLQSRYDPCGFEETVRTFPQIEDFLGQLILSELSFEVSKEQLPEELVENISVFQAELAAKTAWKKETKDYTLLLTGLAEEKKFQTPLILYVTAVSLADTSPEETVGLLIKASVLQESKNTLEAQETAKQAAQLAYNLFEADANNCTFATQAFENYEKLSKNQMNEELEYLYTHILHTCGDSQSGGAILKKIAAGNGKFSKKAILDLAAHKVRTEAYQDINIRLQLLKQFADSIEDVNDCIYIREMLVLIKDTVENIEFLQSQLEDFSETLVDLRKIAQFVYKCNSDQRANPVIAEISTFFSEPSSTEKESAEKIISQPEELDMNIDLERCRARLFQKQQEFEKAAELWAKIGKTIKSETKNKTQPDWKWWRTKFYELYCWSKMPDTQKKDVLHNIEVLQNSFCNVPSFWAEKLHLLKQNCSD